MNFTNIYGLFFFIYYYTFLEDSVLPKPLIDHLISFKMTGAIGHISLEKSLINRHIWIISFFSKSFHFIIFKTSLISKCFRRKSALSMFLSFNEFSIILSIRFFFNFLWKIFIKFIFICYFLKILWIISFDLIFISFFFNFL